MIPRFLRQGATLGALALVACGGAEEADAGPGAAERSPAGQEVRACEVLDIDAARTVIGPDTEHPGGDTEQLTCIYVNPGVAMLTVQLGDAALYDQITILQPHTPVEVGDRGRSNVQETGVVALQFVAGAYSATLSIQPIGNEQSDYLEGLTTAAGTMASRMR